MTRSFLILAVCTMFLAGAAQVQAASRQAPAQPQIAGVTISNTPHRAATRQEAVRTEQAKPALAQPADVKRVVKEQSAQGKVQTNKAESVKVKNNKAEPKKVKADNKKQAKVSVQQSNWRLKVAQQKLNVLGLSEEKPNGRMTMATTEALKRFQKEHHLKVHGELDETTYRKLTWEAFTKEGIKNVQGKEVVSKAAKYKGVPYVFGGTTPKGFDCSGYVQYVFKNCQAQLPRLADEQALEGVFITQKQLRPGDLVFFTTYAAGASHVGIYAGSGQFWSASSKGVSLSSLTDDYWKNHYYGARRVLVANGEV